MKSRYVSYLAQRMYQMSDKPTELPLNSYILRYKETGEGSWLACFLHCYEGNLNKWVFRVCDKYDQFGRFEDIKQTMVQTLLEKLDEYDPTVGTSLLQFAARDMLNSVHDYMRKNVGIYLLSDKYYFNLRRVNAIYYRDAALSPAACIQVAVTETGLTQRQVENYVMAGKWFRYPKDIESNLASFGQAKQALDPYSDPADIVPRALFYDELVERIEALRARDRELLLDYLGITCLHCGRAGKKVPLADLADRLQLRDEQSVTRRVRRIVEELRAGLVEQGWTAK